METSTVIGLILGIVLVIGSILIGGPLSRYIDVPSLVIVVGETLRRRPGVPQLWSDRREARSPRCGRIRKHGGDYRRCRLARQRTRCRGHRGQAASEACSEAPRGRFQGGVTKRSASKVRDAAPTSKGESSWTSTRSTTKVGVERRGRPLGWRPSVTSRHFSSPSSSSCSRSRTPT